MLYALSFTWVEAHIQCVAALGKVRLPDVTGVPDWGWFAILSATAAVVFWLIETRLQPDPEAATGNPNPVRRELLWQLG